MTILCSDYDWTVHSTKTRFFRAFQTPVGAYARRPAPAPMTVGQSQNA